MIKAFFMTISAGFICLAVGVFFGLGYLGCVPLLSSLMGTDTPRDLGVTYTKDQYTAFNDKGPFEVISLSEPLVNGKTIEFSGESVVNTSFSQEEVSARISYSEWKYMPVSDFQVRFGDGEIEFSGYLVLDRLNGFVRAAWGTDNLGENIHKALTAIGTLGKNPPIYAKGSVTVINTEMTLKFERIEIGRVPVPQILWNTDRFFKKAVENIMNQTPGFQANLITFTNGTMHFEGTVPNRETIVVDAGEM